MLISRKRRRVPPVRFLVMDGTPKIPTPFNEPVLSYAPGTAERAELKRTLKELSGRQLEIPLVIGGKDVHTGRTVDVVMPHCHRHVLAKAHQAGPAELQAAIAAAREAWRDWSAWGFEQRAAVFLKAADLLATRYRPIVNGATMLGQSKTAHQAEIDAACELIDFFRFNVHYAERIYAEQPLSVSGVWNYLDYRPLEGFVYAITPFNFTSIGGNLPTAPAIMGNTVVWKPAATAVLSNSFIMRLLAEAGLPPGVINFVPGPSVQVSERVPADGRRDGWQGLHPRAPERGPGRARHGHGARRLRISGAEVQRGLARLCPRRPLARGPGSHPRDARRGEGGRPGGLPQFHGGGDRPEGVRQDQGLYRRGEAGSRREGPVRRWRRRLRRLLHRADGSRSPGPGVSHDERGYLRAGP